ncbi:MAG: hypothetical protein VX424_02190 [Actinomycetota bacterium]|nr:hypothetical protein [Actinomycetota bacterium]
MIDMSPDDFVGSYLYGLYYRMCVDELGVEFDKCDESDLRAIGAMSTVACKLADKGESPHDGALAHLAVATAALLLCPRGDHGITLTKKWRTALNEFIAIQQSAGKWQD